MEPDLPAPSPSLESLLPGRPHRLDHDAVLASQRGRLIAAMARAVATKGYAETSVADVVALAGVSRRTFYELFSNKEECFLAAYDTGVDLVLGRILTALAEMGDVGWRRRLDRALRVYVDAVASEPEFARTFHLEVLAAGARAMQRRAEVLGRFADALRLAHIAARREDPSLPEVSDEVLAGLVGGIHELVLERIRTRGPNAVPELHPAFVDLAVAVLGRV